MEFIGELTGVVKDIVSGKYNITFQTNELPASINDTKGVLKIKAVKNRKKRSLDANSYAWALMSQIADVVKTSKDEIYEEMLQKYGHFYINAAGGAEMISVLYDIDISKYGLHVKFAGEGHAGGKRFRHYYVIRGSSEYDTKEMASFIDGVVSEAKGLGIDTIPKVELDKIKEKWRL